MKKLKLKLIFIIIGILSFSIIAFGITYAWFTWQSNPISVGGISGCFNVNYGSGSNISGTILPTNTYNGTGSKNTIISMNLDPACVNESDECPMSGTATIQLITTPGSCSNPSYTTSYSCTNNGGIWTGTDTIMFSGALKYAVYQGANLISNGVLSLRADNIHVLATNIPLATVSTPYTIYLWLDENNVSNNYIDSTFVGTVKAVAIQKPCNVSEVIVDLIDGMIPIKYNDTLNRWEKADINNLNFDWYNYDEQRWANAVLVSNKATYISANIGDPVLENDILAYYVYIPRFRYKLFNASNTNTGIDEQIIDVILETKYTKPSCGGHSSNASGCLEAVAPYQPNDRIYSSGTNGTWLTHPAFRFGSTEINGIWVGKFETSINTDSPCYTCAYLNGNETSDPDTTGRCNTQCNITTLTPYIKPNVSSWRYNNISTAFTVTRKFSTESMYGINTTSADSHMMKNMEWGAIAYLTQSKYGRMGIGLGEVYINPSRTFITGRSGNTVSQANTSDAIGEGASTLYSYDGRQCNTKDGHICTGTKSATLGMSASTTGNITGVYDISGGAWDRTMGNMAQNSANYLTYTMYPSSAGTVFGAYNNTNLPHKYYEIYDNAGSSNCDVAYPNEGCLNQSRGFLGDATKETLKTYGTSLSGGWNSDYSYFPYATNSWFSHGGYRSYTTGAGALAFLRTVGVAYWNHGVRGVLAHED